MTFLEIAKAMQRAGNRVTIFCDNQVCYDGLITEAEVEFIEIKAILTNQNGISSTRDIILRTQHIVGVYRT